MSRDEKFIKSWEKERGKGDDFQRLIKYLPIFFGCLIGFTVRLPLNWNRNEEKYKQLLSDE